MTPARSSQRLGTKTKLLALTSNGEIQHKSVKDICEYLSTGDLLVVNHSGTLPSSFRGQLQRTGEFVEVRLAAFQGPSHNDLRHWLAFAFGSGDWTTPTEERGQPPQLFAGDRIHFGFDLALEIVSCQRERLLEIRFLSSKLVENLYRFGKPIQYSYLTENLQVWDQQTLFAGPPISVEPPSASFPLTWDLIFSLRRRGVQIGGILHGAGISSTGSVELDKLLPLAEWCKIPDKTVQKFMKAKENNNRIVALGTTVLRALESAWDGTRLRVGSRLTTLKITPSSTLKTANALVTGMHDVGTSHMNILDSLCPIDQIRAGYQQAEMLGYRSHEYGDIAYLDCAPTRKRI